MPASPLLEQIERIGDASIYHVQVLLSQSKFSCSVIADEDMCVSHDHHTKCPFKNHLYLKPAILLDLHWSCEHVSHIAWCQPNTYEDVL